MQSLETEFVKVEINVHNVHLVMRIRKVLLLKHLLWFNQTTKAETDLLLRHAHAFEQGFSKDAHCVSLEHFLKCSRIFGFRLGNCFSEMNAEELPQISE